MEQTNLLNFTELDEDTLRGKYLIFAMDKELYGIEIRYITEIIGMQPITEVPEMPHYIKGITNLRGKIIPVMDARLRFNKPEKEYDEKTCIIVIDTGSVSTGLIVDRVAEVVSIADEDIAPPPEIDGVKYLQGVGMAGGSVRLLLDCRKIVTGSDAELLSSIY